MTETKSVLISHSRRLNISPLANCYFKDRVKLGDFCLRFWWGCMSRYFDKPISNFLPSTEKRWYVPSFHVPFNYRKAFPVVQKFAAIRCAFFWWHSQADYVSGFFRIIQNLDNLENTQRTIVMIDEVTQTYLFVIIHLEDIRVLTHYLPSLPLVEQIYAEFCSHD